MPAKSKKNRIKDSLRNAYKQTQNQRIFSSNSLQPEEKKQAPTTSMGGSALADVKMFTPVFPVSTRKKLMYYEPGISLTGTAGVLAQYVFSANGCYDPNITSTGHQPLGWDTGMQYYEQCTVISSKISVRACGNGTQAASFSISLAPDTTTAVLPDVVENGLAVVGYVDGRANGGYGTGDRLQRLHLSCNVAKYFGRPNIREIVDDPNLFCTAAANPVEQVYYLINTWGFGTFSDNTSVAMDVVIEYDCVFWEPRKVASQFRRDTRPPLFLLQKTEKNSQAETERARCVAMRDERPPRVPSTSGR